MSSAANFNLELLSLNNIEVTKAGFLYVYVSLESNVSQGVFFDDLKVTHGHSVVVQKDDYYPFGLTFNSYQKTGITEQNFKHTGKEEQDEWGVIDFGARMYDAAVGRWIHVDNESERGYHLSPYSYSFNNPIRYVDPDGDWPWESKTVRQARKFAKATGGIFYKSGKAWRMKTGIAASVNINGTTTYQNAAIKDGHYLHDIPRQFAKRLSIIDFQNGGDYSFLFNRPEVLLANSVGAVAIVLEELIVLGVLSPFIFSSNGSINIDALLKFAQRGKQDHSLTQEQINANNAILNDPDASKKEKNTAKQKLNRHEKTQGDRNKQKRKNSKRKKPKKKKNKNNNQEET